MPGLFDRQVARAFGAFPPAGPAWEQLRKMVESAYASADSHRRMVERSLTLMSDELHQRNEELNRRLRSLAEQASVLEGIARGLSLDLTVERIVGMVERRIRGTVSSARSGGRTISQPWAIAAERCERTAVSW